MRKISSNLWLMKRIALPSAFSFSTRSKSSAISLCDKAAVGSSMMTTRASTDSARATATRCLLAMPSSRSRTRGSISAPTRASIARASSFIRAQSISPSRVRGACPRKMFSATESSSKSTVSWWMAVTPARAAAWAVGKATGAPSSAMLPSSGW